MNAKRKENGLSSPLHGGLENPPSVADADLGPLPSSWRVAPLGDFLTQAQYGMSVKGGIEGRCPILRMTNQVNGRISPTKLQYAEITDRELASFRVQRGDILFNRTNSFELVGRTSIFDVPGDFVFASYLIRLRTLADQLDPFFLNLYLNADETQRRLKGIATRAVSQSNISATRLKGFTVPVPPLAEQGKIAGVLGVVQRAREQQERVLALTAELKKALLHQLFTSGLRGEPKKQTDIGPVPQSWEVKRLDEVATIIMGQSPDGDSYNADGKGVPLINGPVEFGPNPLSKTLEVKFTTEPTKFCERGDLILCVRGSTTGRTNLANGRACIGRGVAVIRSSGNQKYLNQFIVSIRDQIYAMGTGTTFPNISGSQIKEILIPVPPLAVQVEIGGILASVDHKHELLERKHATLTDLFRTLLHQLMTAQIRVHDLVFLARQSKPNRLLRHLL